MKPFSIMLLALAATSALGRAQQLSVVFEKMSEGRLEDVTLNDGSGSTTVTKSLEFAKGPDSAVLLKCKDFVVFPNGETVLSGSESSVALKGRMIIHLRGSKKFANLSDFKWVDGVGIVVGSVSFQSVPPVSLDSPMREALLAHVLREYLK